MFEPTTFVNGSHCNKEGQDCPHCDNVGWYVGHLTTHNEYGEQIQIQVQCEWCYTNPNSKFNLNEKKT
jgi:hypothetical protein